MIHFYLTDNLVKFMLDSEFTISLLIKTMKKYLITGYNCLKNL
jgi:hypothetical protein